MGGRGGEKEVTSTVISEGAFMVPVITRRLHASDQPRDLKRKSKGSH